MEEKSRATWEQQKILDSRAKNLVISASAGSGKTYILIEKLKQLICKEHVRVERLLVLTFTKVASEEMKTRLTNTILSMKPTKELIESLDSLPLSDISTIDSFCEKIIKRNISKLEIDENFVVLDEKNALKLKNVAFLNTYQHFARNFYEKFEEIYLAFKKNKSLFQECIFAIQDFCGAIDDEESKLEYFENHISEINNLAQNRIKMFIRETFDRAEIFLSKTKDMTLSSSEENFVNDLQEIFNLSLEGNIFDVCQRINSYSMPSLKGRHKEEIKAVLLPSRELIKPVFEIVKKYEYLPDGGIEQAENGWLIKSILEFYRYYIDVYASLKTKKSGLDFTDIEKFAKRLLLDDEVKKSLQNKYDYIFIDEYQDTNKLQEGILKPIAEGGYFTAVGDIKQGIYGFRNASMEIMQNDIENFSKSDDGDALYLNGNFRTDEGILSFVNIIFEKIMTKESVGIDYKDKSMLKGLKNFLKGDLPPVCVDLVCESKTLEKTNLIEHSSEIIIEKNEKTEQNEENRVYSVRDDSLVSDSSQDDEIKAIINKIQLVLNSKIYDSKLEKYRKAELGDIALLFRGRSKLMQQLVMRLRSMGLSVNADLKDALIEDSQIALLNSLLKLTLNLNDDISLASIMCSPFGCFSVDELANIRFNAQEKERFCDIVLNSDDEKVLELKKVIEQFKFDIQIFGVVKALGRLFNKFNFYDYLISLENGKQKIASINSLFKLIKNSKLDFNVSGIISLLESSSDIRVGEGGSNALTITTIHATKGLEYPIVILCGAGESLSKVYNKSYILSERYGLGCSLFDFEGMIRIPSPAFLAGKLDLEKREFIDEIMIFYVALTRAQNHLFIIGKAKEKDFSFIDVKSQNSYLKFILFAFGENFTTQLFNEGKISIENINFNIIYDDGEMIENDFKRLSQSYLNSDKFAEDIENYINFKYDKFDECRLSFKNSVTGVMQQGEQNLFDNFNDNEEQMRVANRENAIMTGNAYHEALKLIDFDLIKSENDLVSLSDFLKENMTEGYFEKIDLSLLFNNISKLKEAVYGRKIFKEKEFIMMTNTQEIKDIIDDERINHAEKNIEIIDEDGNNIIVQGIVDLFAINDDIILIDYKYTSCKDEKTIIKRYQKQLNLYGKALEKAFGKAPKESYILSLKEGKLIKAT